MELYRMQKVCQFPRINANNVLMLEYRSRLKSLRRAFRPLNGDVYIIPVCIVLNTIACSKYDTSTEGSKYVGHRFSLLSILGTFVTRESCRDYWAGFSHLMAHWSDRDYQTHSGHIVTIGPAFGHSVTIRHSLVIL